MRCGPKSWKTPAIMSSGSGIMTFWETSTVFLRRLFKSSTSPGDPLTPTLSPLGRGCRSRFAAKSRHKKRARMPRVPITKSAAYPYAREASLDQILQLRKGFSGPINREFCRFAWGVRAPPSLFELRRDGIRREALAKLRSSEGWWRPGLELNQDKERCTAPASTPFRHRAVRIIAHREGASHALCRLTLTPSIQASGPRLTFASTSAGCATNVIRQGLWPIFCGARTAEKPDALSLAIMSTSL